MKKCMRLTILVILFTGFIGKASTQSLCTTPYSANMNVRSGSSIAHQKIGSLPWNGQAEYIGTQDGWYNIRLVNGIVGYVHGSYVHNVNCNGNVAPAPPTDSNTTTTDIIGGNGCMRFQSVGGILVELGGLPNNEPGLTIPHLERLANYLDANIPGTFNRSNRIVYFISDPNEGSRLFPKHWNERSIGMNGMVHYDGCSLHPVGPGHNGNYMINVNMNSLGHELALEATAHEMAHAQGASHGAFGKHVADHDPNLPFEQDAYGWGYLVGKSLVRGCQAVQSEMGDAYIGRCIGVRQAFGL